MLVASIFSFSLNVFKGLMYKGHFKSGLHGKGLNNKISNLSILKAMYRKKYFRKVKCKFGSNDRTGFERTENHCGKRRKMLVTSASVGS